SNPFTPYITAVASADPGDATVHGTAHELLGSIHAFGGAQHLYDEIGRNIGTISHLTHDSAIFHDGSGASMGSAHTMGDTTVVNAKTGAAEAYIHHGPGGHDTIVDDHHSSLGTVDHQGHVDVYHDATHGITQTVDHH